MLNQNSGPWHKGYVKINLEGPMELYCGNKSAIDIAHNPSLSMIEQNI